MINEGEAVRTEGMDDVFEHLRNQDAKIEQLHQDISFIVKISQNLEGFSNFCARWGKRINRFLKWLTLIGPGAALLWEWLAEPIKAFFKAKGS